MKKCLSVLLMLLFLLQIAPIASFADTSEIDYIELTPYEMYYTNLYAQTYEYEVLCDEDNINYLHLTSTPGSYGNNDYMIYWSSSKSAFNMLDYPIVKIGYRTNSPTTVLDATIVSSKGENWAYPKHSQVTDGEYHDVVIDINDLCEVETRIPDYEDGTDMLFRIKPLGAGEKVLTDSYYYNIYHVSFFKTEEDALAHTYVYDPENDDYGGITTAEINYQPLTDEVEDKIISGADALKEEIMSAESISPDTITGTCYYVSNDGSDENDGKSPETAFATVKAINALDLEAGDGVFFRRGDVFRGKLSVQTGVTFSAYGEGEKPRLYNSIDASSPDDWEETQYKNVWVYKSIIYSTEDIGNIIFNGGEAWGIKICREPDYTRQYQGLVYTGYESFVSSGEFLDERHLKHNLEYWHQWETGNLFLYCDYGNPGDIFDSVEMSKKGHIISGRPIDVVVDNLALMYTGGHGISLSNSENFTVQNCYFAYIGGSLQYSDGRTTRYGNAVENWASCDGFTIDHCYATQIYDCCYTTQWQGKGSETDIIMQNVVFSDTVSEYSNSGPEVWLSANDSDTTHTYLIKDMEAYGNYVLNGGYGWSHQRPNKDGNFFYGGSAGATTVFDNVEYHDNIFFKASSIAVKARYSKLGYGYNFRDNTFVMAEGQDMVETGNDLSNCSGKTIRYQFEPLELKVLTFFGFFPNATYYYYDINDAGVPMPDIEPPRDPDFVFTPKPTVLPEDYTIVEAADILDYAPNSYFYKLSYEDELVKDEDGVEYFRINSHEGTYGDSQCVFNFPLSALGEEIVIDDYPYVRIGYKTNITSGATPAFDYYTNYNSKTTRLWGPQISRISDEQPHYSVIGAKYSIHGGSGITNFSWENVGKGALYETLHLKLWGSQTIEVAADEYYDISYIAFFKNISDAMLFEYPETEPLYGDVNGDSYVDAADEIYLTRFNASIQGYLSLPKMRAADVNSDNLISPADPVILARHVAGWREYASLPYVS